MPSSTSLYSSTPGNANVASQNFTTLYSGSGTINPTQAYGNANVVSLLAVGTDGGNTIGNITATGNVTADYFIGNIDAGNIVGNVNFANTAGTAQFVTGNAQANITSVGTLTTLSVSGNITGGNLLTGGTITATGNITAPNFIGNVIGNLQGNIAAAGSNTQIQFNTGNILDASANLTFDKSTNTLKVTGNTTYPTSGLEITKSSIVGNLVYGNLLISNEFQGNPGGFIHLQAYEVLVGNPNDSYYSNAPIRAVNREALQLTTTGNGAPGIIIGKYEPAFAPMTGNIDVYTSNVGGYGGTGNLNLSGNVYVSRDAQGADATFGKANLIVRDSIFVDQGISAAGNIQGNVFIGNGAGLTNINASNIIGAYGNANVSNFLANGFGSNTIVTTGNITGGNLVTAGNLFGNVVGQTFTGVGTANVTIQQFGNIGDGSALNLKANLVVVGAGAGGSNACTIVSPPGAGLELAASGDVGGGGYIKLDELGNVQITGYQSGQNGKGVNLYGNTHIGVTVPAGIGSATSQGNLIVANAVYVGESISAAGNITANASSFFIGNGSQLTGIVATSTYGNANVADFLANGFGSNTITTTGNIAAGTITATGNIGSSQQTIIGTANATASSTGNIVLSGKNIATDVVFAPDASTTTTPAGGRVLIGAGVAGNTSLATYDTTNILRGPRVAIMDSWTKNNAAVVSGALTTWSAVALDGNITAAGSRVHGISSFVTVSGGAAGNTYLTTGGGAINNGLNALQGTLQLGGGNPNLVTQIGANITTRYATATAGILQFNGNGTVVGNGYGHMSSVFNNAAGNISIANVAAYGVGMLDLVTTTANVGNAIGYLFPDTLTQQFGLQSINNSFQRSGNIYAFMNAGNLAQVRLGSTREQHYYAFPITPTTGNVIVDASKGKVQTLTLTGNVAVTDFTNFVTLAFNNGTSQNIPQQDDVTLIIQQPSTGPTYTVTLPTTVNSGASPVQYQNGVTAVNTDNLGRTYVNIRSQPDSMGGYPYYVVVESTAGSLPAAGTDTQVQFNDGNVLTGINGFSYVKTTATLAAGNILAYNGAANVWGNINAANYFTQPGGLMTAGNITAATQVSTPTLYANTIADGGFVGTGDIQVNAANVFATGNINVSKNFYANIINAGTYVSTPSLFVSDLTPPGGGALNTTTTLSTINGNLSVTGTITGTGNITGGNLRTAGQVSATGNITTGSFFKAQSYTAAALNAITGSIGQIAAVSDSAGGGNPNGMLAFWDTTNARWSYIHDNTAV